ncbi:hypothetical protein AVEN_246457-1 [Araneus ventricosus]|uniref:Uncharacterized protein n=1 Tax=Araneus ventricosus TaxID=182803 RepID=A0A4Y2EMZ6_ARAVE|nr:hypothetical protein AVEN_246457-1 [Araneus ventricosus]
MLRNQCIVISTTAVISIINASGLLFGLLLTISLFEGTQHEAYHKNINYVKALLNPSKYLKNNRRKIEPQNHRKCKNVTFVDCRAVDDKKIPKEIPERDPNNG